MNLKVWFRNAILFAVAAPTVAFGLPKAPKGNPEGGKEVFKNICSSCHKMGEKMIGPDLTGVKSRWKDYDKLIDFVQHPTNYIDKDPYVIKLQKEAGGSLMAVGPITAQQAADVIEWADAGGGAGAAPAAGAGGPMTFAPIPADASFPTALAVVVLLLIGLIVYMVARLRKVLPSEDTTVTKNDRPANNITGIQRINAFIAPIFLIVCGILLYMDIRDHYPNLRPVPASDMGVQIDRLFWNTFYITAIVFVVTQILLFWYIFRYRGKVNAKAFYFPHNNTLEYVWTIIPAIVLSFLVLDGFKVWQSATDTPPENSVVVETFAKQFAWTVRYPGPDGKLGRVDFRLITGDNPLGIDFTDEASKDDFLAPGDMMLPKLPEGKEVHVKVRSQDVTHAAYFPHFRMQIYAQPGMDNRLLFAPNLTTEEIRKESGNPKFNYELACNQLCGGAHWNMRKQVTVVSLADYNKWMNDMKSHPAAYDAVKDKMALSATATNNTAKASLK